MLQFDPLLYRQLLRFGTVGIIFNLLLYLSYLLITYLGIGHKLAMTLLYMTGVGVTFIFNRNWTFAHKGHISGAFVSYVSVYALGYLLNLAGLYYLVDIAGFRHEPVQGVLILLIALLLFVAQKKIVFDTESADAD